MTEAIFSEKDFVYMKNTFDRLVEFHRDIKNTEESRADYKNRVREFYKKHTKQEVIDFLIGYKLIGKFHQIIFYGFGPLQGALLSEDEDFALEVLTEADKYFGEDFGVLLSEVEAMLEEARRQEKIMHN
jgi:hypothetical protein